MKKFFLIPIILLLAGAGCNSNELAKQSSTSNIEQGSQPVVQTQNQQVLTNTNQQTSDFDLGVKCSGLGREYFDSHLSDYKNINSNALTNLLLDGPYFHFNKKLQLCLLEYKITSFKHPIINGPIDDDYRLDEYIIDVVSGETDAFAVVFWKNHSFQNEFNRTQYNNFENQEADLMQG